MVAHDHRATTRRPRSARGTAHGAVRVLRHLRPDLGVGLRHDQLHDHRHARRLVRLEPGPEGATASTTRCRSPTSTATSRSSRTASSCTWPATRRSSTPTSRTCSARPGARYSTEGKNGYVPNPRLTRTEQQIQAGAPAGTSPQDRTSRTRFRPTFDPASGLERLRIGGQRGRRHLQRRHARRRAGDERAGHRLRQRRPARCSARAATATSACRRRATSGSRSHEDYNQSFLYAQAGLTAAVNQPQAGNSMARPRRRAGRRASLHAQLHLGAGDERRRE